MLVPVALLGVVMLHCGKYRPFLESDHQNVVTTTHFLDLLLYFPYVLFL